jgi:hypothetical protein
LQINALCECTCQISGMAVCVGDFFEIFCLQNNDAVDKIRDVQGRRNVFLLLVLSFGMKKAERSEFLGAHSFFPECPCGIMRPCRLVPAEEKENPCFEFMQRSNIQ